MWWGDETSIWPGLCLNSKTVFPGISTFIKKIRWLWYQPIFVTYQYFDNTLNSRSTSMRMARINEACVNIGTAIGVTTILSALAVEHCRLFSVSEPYHGRHCPGDGMAIPHLLPDQCQYICLASPTCNAYNYNTTERTCTRFVSPCLQAIPDNVMEFAVFTEKTQDQCYQWIPYNSGDAVDPRMVSTNDAYRIICRMQKDGDDIVCFYDSRISKCFAIWESPEFNNIQGYPCQRLRIMEDCTVFWVPYTAGHPIHPRAVIGGHMANGDVVYVTKFDFNYQSIISLAGHYVDGADDTVATAAGVARKASTMMMLIVL